MRVPGLVSSCRHPGPGLQPLVAAAGCRLSSVSGLSQHRIAVPIEGIASLAYLLHIDADLVCRLALEHAHDEQKRQRVDKHPQRDAVQEPFGHGVGPVVQPSSPLQRLVLLRRQPLCAAARPLVLALEVVSLVLGLGDSLWLWLSVVVGWKRVLEQLLELDVHGRGEELEDEEAGELGNVEGDGALDGRGKMVSSW